jgi:hypothetical protein
MTAWRLEHNKLMQAANIFLTSALMMPKPAKEPAVKIDGWTQLDGDKF